VRSSLPFSRSTTQQQARKDNPLQQCTTTTKAKKPQKANTREDKKLPQSPERTLQAKNPPYRDGDFYFFTRIWEGEWNGAYTNLGKGMEMCRY